MRALWVSCHLPYPPISGGRLRELELLRRITAHADVHVVAVSKDLEHDRAHVDRLRATVGLAGVEVHPTEPDETAPCAIVGRHASPSATRAVARRLAAGGADLVHLEGFYLAQHLPVDGTPPVVLVDQNVEFDLWRQRAASLGVAALHGGEESLAVSQWRREAQRCRTAEVAAWRQATVCATVTEDDAELVRAAAPDVVVEVVPDGCDHLTAPAASPPRRRGRQPRLLYVGNYAYEPNADAARLLVDEVLPRVRAAVPGARLAMVGNAPPAWLRGRARHDTALAVPGRVPDVLPYLHGCDLMVLPLRIGGGVKVKVLEGLAAGVPIITTPVGAQGLRGADAPLVVEPDADRLAAAVVEVLADEDRRQQLAAAGRRLAAQLPTWDDAAARLLATWERARSGGAAVLTA